MADLGFLPLLQNAALLLSIALIYDLASAHWPLRKAALARPVMGVLIGSIGILIMLTPWVFEPGVVLDTRSVLLAIAGLVFGPIPTAVAIVMTAAFRLSQGGVAAGAGAAVILASGLIGVTWRRLRHESLESMSLRELYALGLVVHAVMLLLMLTLPGDTAWKVLGAISLPVILINPVATAALGGLMVNRLRRERADAAVRVREERLRLGLEAADQGLYDVNVQTGQATVNDQYARMLGYEPSAFHETHDTWLERLHPDDRERVEGAFAGYIAGRRPDYRIEFRLRTAAGGWMWILSSGEIAEWDARGAPLRMLGTHTDVTALRQAREEAREAQATMAVLLEQASSSRQALVHVVEDLKEKDREVSEAADRYLGLLRHAPDAILVGRGDRIVLANDAAVALFGALHERDLIGKSPYQLFDRADQRAVRTRIRTLERTLTGAPLVEQRIARISDGSIVDVEVAASPFADRGGVSIHFILRDITQRKRAEAALRLLTEELEERVRDRTAELVDANRELEAFAYSVSHDLRAPLRAMSSFSQILATRHAGSLDDEGRHYLDNIVVSSGHMEQLIEDLLRYSRLGRRAVRAEPVALEPLVARLRRTFEPQLADPDARLQADDLAATPLGDPLLVEQVLLNLVSNALTYRREGISPRVAISSAEVDGQVTLSVEDNGIGIDAEHQASIFDVFTRLHSDEEYPGTGIGLAIVRKAARMMGGEVCVDSTPGSGSRFIVQLPAATDRAS